MKILVQNLEELTANTETDVTADWLETIGGSDLVGYVFRVFCENLVSVTLADLCQRFIDNLWKLNQESETNSDIERTQVSCVYSHRPCSDYQQGKQDYS